LIKKNFILLFILFFAQNLLLGQEESKIYSQTYPQSLDINFGPCFVGDSIFSDFILMNNTNSSIPVTASKPSFSIEISPLQAISDEFRSFTATSQFPFLVPENTSKEISIKYTANPNIVIYPTGWYHANLELGLMNDNDTIAHEYFQLRCKKTLKYIDGYEDTLRFDSCYVNPPDAQAINWKVKSTFLDSIAIINQNYTLLSQQLTPREISAEIFSVNPIFRKKYDEIDWVLSYRPYDTRTDTGRVELTYKPFPDTYPDSIQTASVIAIGLGVKQELYIEAVNENFTISGDTIYVGTHPLNAPFRLKAIVRNKGNLPFGTISEKMSSDLYQFDYSIVKKLTSLQDLSPSEIDSFTVDITPSELGYFNYQYNLESDIFDKSRRNILFPPNDAKVRTFYVVGKAVEPILQLLSDSINFGNLYIYMPYCESSKDSLVVLHNIGNDTLRISKINIENQTPIQAFSTYNPELTISPSGSKGINIKFEPTVAQSYNADLYIYSNSKDSPKKIKLKGLSAYPPFGSIKIDTIYGKPGSIVNIPIRVDSNIVHANEFSDTLFYNRSLVHYVGFSIENTATTQPLIEPVQVKEFQDGKLFVKIKKNPQSRFSRNPILINLQFKAFLGDSKSTELAFSNPRFSNEICHFALLMPESSIHNGVFIIDSICGIDLKAFPQFIISGLVYPNPASGNVKFKFDLSEKANLSFDIFDTFGMRVMTTEDIEFSVGENEKAFDLSDLNFGVYYLRARINDVTFFNYKILIMK